MTRALLLVLMASVAAPAAAASLTVIVRDARGLPVSNAVAWAVREGGPAQTVAPAPAVMDQKNRMFVPHVIVVQTGATVSFPNSDDVQHQVYSFSPARPFQLPLYKGNPPRPIVFDRPGIVSLGCNIHDRMSAWIVVVDTPWSGAGERGRIELTRLPAGRYTVHVWYPGLRSEIGAQTITLHGSAREELTFTARK